MLDPRSLRQDPQAVAQALRRRGFNFDVAAFTALEDRRKTLQTTVETLQNERNTRSKLIGRAKAGNEDVTALVAAMGTVNAQLETTKTDLEHLLAEIERLLLLLPNVPDPSVPDGANEDQNVELRRWREAPVHNFTARDHVDLGAASGGIDFESATRIAGTRFVVLRGAMARLQRALTQFMLDVHTAEHGYQEVYVPYIVNATSLHGTGQLPNLEEDLFRLTGDDGYYLAPTAEVPVTNLVRERILEDAELPLRMVCHTPCFRREAGSYGKDTRGMIRQHQFEKVELVQVVRPEQSRQAHEELTGHAEEILRRLELPYRAMALCAGDLGFSAARTIDLEVWLPGQGRYREISSCSTFTDFQARRLQARWRNPSLGRPELVHTVNGSGLAVGRTLVAVLENYQDGDGRVHIPDVLLPYMGGVSVI